MRAAQRTRAGLACGAAIVLALAACKAKENSTAGSANADTNQTVASGVENVSNRPFNGNVEQAKRGRYLFVEYNCYGCHGGLAGGAMGPSLRDTVWKYGGTDQAITASIHDGRPMGMPAWGNMLSASQISDLLAYIRSLRTNAEPKFFFIDEMKDSSFASSSTAAKPQ